MIEAQFIGQTNASYETQYISFKVNRSFCRELVESIDRSKSSGFLTYSGTAMLGDPELFGIKDGQEYFLKELKRKSTR
jgi:hypothetical protein